MNEIFDEVYPLEHSKDWYGIATKFQTDLTPLEICQLCNKNFNKILIFISEKNIQASDLTILLRPVSIFKAIGIGLGMGDFTDAYGTFGIKFKGSIMNHIDNSKQQYQMYGNSVRTHETKTEYRFPLDYPKSDPIPQNEKILLRTLVSEMSKTGNFAEAMDIICETIEKLQERIKELEEK